MGAAECEAYNSTIRKRILLSFPLQDLLRPVAHAGILTLRQQQVAVAVTSHRIEQRVLGLPLLLPLFGFGE
jgi:hypothetical protein